MFNKVVEGCSWLIPQSKLDNANHTYYTYGIKYDGVSNNNISWKEFYDRYKSMGGDGFYAAWMNPYLEPALKGKKYGNAVFKAGLCPIAEEVQKKLMVFKTNYRSLEVAEKNAQILRKVINSY